MRVLDLTTETVTILALAAAKFCKKYTTQIRRAIKFSLKYKKISPQDYALIAVLLQELESALGETFVPNLAYRSRFIKLQQIKKMIQDIHKEYDEAQKRYDVIHVKMFTYF